MIVTGSSSNRFLTIQANDVIVWRGFIGALMWFIISTWTRDDIVETETIVNQKTDSLKREDSIINRQLKKHDYRIKRLELQHGK